MSSGSDEGEYSSIQDRNRSLKAIRREDPKKPTSVEGEGYGWPRVSWPSRPPPDPTQQTSVRVLDDMHDGSNPKVHQRREGYCADAEPTGGGPYPPDDEEEDVAPRKRRGSVPRRSTPREASCARRIPTPRMWSKYSTSRWRPRPAPTPCAPCTNCSRRFSNRKLFWRNFGTSCKNIVFDTLSIFCCFFY